MNNVIETIDLTRRFRRADAVDRLTLQVPVGSIFALVGPNGAGKTTTIKLLMNLIRPSRGSAFVLGTDSRQLGPEQFRRIGYVSENQRLPEWMTPDQLLAYVKPFYPTWDEGLCQKLRGDLGLTAAAPLRTLSRGTRMKAALLSSLAYRPELVVLDEPFTGLDPLVRDQLIHALLELTGEQPLSVLVSSHDIEEIERLADWIGYIDAGRRKVGNFERAFDGGLRRCPCDHERCILQPRTIHSKGELLSLSRLKVEHDATREEAVLHLAAHGQAPTGKMKLPNPGGSGKASIA
jgi:ABC-2 type transport system ATP-binding protein